jgi:DNA-binding XRE family transcriptional regulator
MSKYIESEAHAEMLSKLKEVRAAALEHTRIARELARERRQVIDAMLAEGFSQADLARELGVTRQAIQKMVAVGADQPRRLDAKACSTTLAGSWAVTGARITIRPSCDANCRSSPKTCPPRYDGEPKQSFSTVANYFEAP